MIIQDSEFYSSNLSFCGFCWYYKTTKLSAQHKAYIIRYIMNKHHIRVITKLPNSEQSYKWKVKTHKYINRLQSTQYHYDIKHFLFSF
jgi:hypothetical protein